MIRLAKKDEIDRLLEIYACAREFMRKSGNPTQWGNGYPSAELLLSDIENSNLYAVENELGRVWGCFALIGGADSTYSYIEDGQWRSDSDYGTIHRAASDGTQKGLFNACVRFAKTKCDHLRIDTHENNKPMQKVILENGFRYSGIIYIEDGTARKAYDWLGGTVYTVTLNPAVDYVVHTESIKNGTVNRTAGEEIYFGGKGINVSLVLNELGIKTKALGFVAGFTGEWIEKSIAAKGIKTDFVHLDKGFSRINVKIKSCEETEINGQGPEIDDASVDKLFTKLDSLKDGDTLVLAGSAAHTLPDDIYEKILARISGKKIMTVVDASGNLLKKVLKYKPFLIKPNKHELGELFGVNISSEEEIEKYAAQLKGMGARNVLVSMAGDGALLLDEDGALHRVSAVSGEVKNSVGAGDSMVAGFIAGIVSGNYDYALRLGAAAGSATAFSDGVASKAEIMELFDKNERF